MANDVMIEAKGLTKWFGGFRALDRVSFEVRRGEVVGFLGPNGAGKSTTMRILSCFISATSGTARVHGIDAFDDPLAVRRKLGYLPQRAPLYGEMTVWDYLKFCADMRGLDDGTFRSRMKKIVEVCGLARVLGKDIRTLSHGYRQRVGLGQALVHDPPILILDEPTSDLDPNERAEVIRYIHETGKNRTILLSTHNLNEVEAVCARAIIVSKGRVVADGPLAQIKSVSGKVRYVVSVDGRKVAGESKGYRGTKPPTAQEIFAELRDLPGVGAAKELPAEGSLHRFELRGSEKSDLRAELYQLALQKGWILGELRRETESLDEAFKALTRDDERADRGRIARDVEEAFSAADDDEDEDEDDDDESEVDDQAKTTEMKAKGSAAASEKDAEDSDDEDEDEDEAADDETDEADEADEADDEADGEEEEDEDDKGKAAEKPGAKGATTSPAKAQKKD